MNVEKTIYCPMCKGKVATIDKRSTIDIIVKCKKCKIYIECSASDCKARIVGKPQRMVSSGMRFY